MNARKRTVVVKIRQDRQVINKAIYLALGVYLKGHKELLGMWLSVNEGAKFWLASSPSFCLLYGISAPMSGIVAIIEWPVTVYPAEATIYIEKSMVL